MKRSFYALFVLLFISLAVSAEEYKQYVTQEDRDIFNRYAAFIKDKGQTTEDIVLSTASFFLDVPYVAATLEKEPEGLVVNLRELDCTTFVESVFALSKTVKEGNLTFEAFCDNLKGFRYRNGIIDGYTSRLHYTTDWIYNNSQTGLVKDVTKSIGGDTLPINLFFMSRNADKYKLLNGNAELIEKMKEIEQSVNAHSYFYIPKEKLTQLQKGIKNGDMICFVTSIPGLDVSHVGIAKWVSGKLTFVHASSTQMKVVVQEGTLDEYIQSVSKNTGIIVVRPQF